VPDSINLVSPASFAMVVVPIFSPARVFPEVQSCSTRPRGVIDAAVTHIRLKLLRLRPEFVRSGKVAFSQANGMCLNAVLVPVESR
jgi:hypothetical protein